MAGVTIQVEFDDAEVRRALDRLAKAGADLTPAMQEIGEVLVSSAKERFSDQTSPDGTPWAPLSEHTRARKPRNKDKVLALDGFLRGTLAYRAGADSVEVGSPPHLRRHPPVQGAKRQLRPRHPLGRHPRPSLSRRC